MFKNPDSVGHLLLFFRFGGFSRNLYDAYREGDRGERGGEEGGVGSLWEEEEFFQFYFIESVEFLS